jgi:hypothetical protein
VLLWHYVPLEERKPGRRPRIDSLISGWPPTGMVWLSRHEVPRSLQHVLGSVVDGKTTLPGSLLLSPGLVLGGRVCSPGENLALWCRRWRRPRVSFSFLIASFGSCTLYRRECLDLSG